MDKSVQSVRIDDIIIRDRFRRDMGDIEGLARSMRELGLLQPVVVTPDNCLIAGERRILAARMLGWDVIPVRVVDLPELLRAERDENMVRKDFTPTEAVAIGRALEPMERDAARERQGERTDQHPVNFTGGSGAALDKVAAAVGMSRPSYAKAAAVVDAADREPDRFGDLPAKMDETGNVSAAHKEMRRRQKEQAKATPQDMPDVTDRYRLICGDIAQVGPMLEAESADIIITDPPYPQEYLPLYETLAQVAARVLKPGGSALVMVGQSYLPDVLARMTAALSYHWTLAYLTPGGQAAQLWQRKVNTFWKPVLWFVKGEYAGDWVGDVAKSAPNDNDKRFHDWGQSESGMADLIERFTYPGQMILDPFCGAGTTGVVALAMGRLFTGIDIDGESIAATKARLGEYGR